jgi:hypothetical protein
MRHIRLYPLNPGVTYTNKVDKKGDYTIFDQEEEEWKGDIHQGQQASQQRKEDQMNRSDRGDYFNHEKCWGEDATLRSMPSLDSLHQRRQDDWQTQPFAPCIAGRRPMTRSSHHAASSSMEAHA